MMMMMMMMMMMTTTTMMMMYGFDDDDDVMMMMLPSAPMRLSCLALRTGLLGIPITRLIMHACSDGGDDA